MTSTFRHLAVLDRAVSVGGLTEYIRELLEDDPQLHQVWVTGEVSSAKPHRSGLFFTLQDPDTGASIDAVIWQSQLQQVAVLPQPGEEVIVLGSLRLYAKRGQYSLHVWQSLPAGEGLQALRLRQLRLRLAAEGLFDDELKQPLPTYPTTVAVVTSPHAAAWGDIQRTLRQRHLGLRVLLSPATVQGDQAPRSIVAAIARVIQHEQADVLILARGGGATEDLACFNDERVVRAIAECPIPVITGIGHQRDETLADLVADVCAHTPTAAAEYAVPCLADLYMEHCQRSSSLVAAVQDALQLEWDRLAQLKQALRHLSPERQLHHEQTAIAWQYKRLVQVTQNRLVRSQQQCQLLRQKLTDIDPNTILRRGYALVRDQNQRVVRSTTGLYEGQQLTVQLAQGEVDVTVNEIRSRLSVHKADTHSPYPDDSNR